MVVESDRTAARATGREIERSVERAAMRNDMKGIAFLCVAYLAMVASGEAMQLITPQEAALPADQMPELTFRGSPTRRPSVTMITPAPNAGVVKSPLGLKIRFQAFGGAKINAESVVVTYMRKPAVNLTQRLAPYIRPDGVEVPDAEVPAGTHQLRIELKDGAGHSGGSIFNIEVVN
jgi:hypothetical protein